MSSNQEQARFNMIEQQIRPWLVLDPRVLEVMTEIPREHFVPDAYQGLAYADIDIPLGETAQMLSPKVVGRMLQALAILPGDRVLVLGAGTGYTSACVAALGGQVTGVELDADLASSAQQRLDAMGFKARIRAGDALASPIDEGPFDAIAVTGSLPSEAQLPLLRQQLAVGGRLFVILGESPLMQAWLETRVAEGEFRREALFETDIPSLQNLPATEHFVF